MDTLELFNLISDTPFDFWSTIYVGCNSADLKNDKINLSLYLSKENILTISSYSKDYNLFEVRCEVTGSTLIKVQDFIESIAKYSVNKNKENLISTLKNININEDSEF